MKCVACNNYRLPLHKNVSYFRIPHIDLRIRDVEGRTLMERRLYAWLEALHIKKPADERSLRKMRVCSAHFVSGKPSKLYEKEDVDWIPSLFLRNDVQAVITTGDSRGDNGGDCRDDNSDECQDDNGSNSEDIDMRARIVSCENIVETNEPERNLDQEIVRLKNQLIEVIEERDSALAQCRLKDEMIAVLLLSEKSFQNDDKKMLYFSGLPNLTTFNAVLCEIEPRLNHVHSTKLNNFQKLLLTLYKLRSNDTFLGLSYKFSIHKHEVSVIFKAVIHILCDTFGSFVHWPSPQDMKCNIADCFQYFKKKDEFVAVVIDCFEIKSERPSTYVNLNDMYSNYKQAYTVKYLIGISPHGAVSFISNGYAGRTSDKMITQDCGILKMLKPGNIILADRGFTIQDEVQSVGAILKTPPFLKRRTQLPPRDVEHTRNIAHARIHVERVIGALKQKYVILNGPVQISLLKDEFLFNQIVRVCCAMLNLCPPIVPI